MKSKFPTVIEKMIYTGHRNGWNAERIATRINNSRTAKRLQVSYSIRTISAKLANINR